MTLTELGENIADKSFDTRPRFVRLTGERSGFIEFDFAIGEPDIHIEMILSEQAFKEFCENNNVTVLEPRAHHHEKVEDIGFEWRLSDATGRLKSKSTEKKSERTDMQIDMKTVAIEPQRKTFDHLKARFGDKVPSRYQEATYDLQVEENMHYRPTWDPEQNLYDKELSKIRMEDWYALKDPRQFYYSTYTLSRARQQEAMESNFKFVESRGLVALMSDELRATALDLLLPLRHENWSANLNNTFICGYGYGTAFTQPCMYHAVDNLGQAQYLSRLGLLLGGKQSLANAKEKWMTDVRWQPLRRYAEDSMVVRDPVQLFMVQNVCLDGILYPLVYEALVDGVLSSQGATAVSMLTQFATDWHVESRKWVDSVIKIMAKESDENKQQLSEWFDEWSDRASSALIPVAEIVMAERADDVVQEKLGELRARMKKAGLNVNGAA